MPEIIIDGRRFEIVEPGAAAGPKTIEAGGRKFEIVDEADDPSFEGGVTRAAAQGLTFGFGDEIEAGAKYLAGGKYRDELDRSRRKISRFKEKHPYIAGGAELAGGLVVPIGAGANLARQGLTLGNVAR